MTASAAGTGAATLGELYAALAPLSIGAGWNKATPSLYPEPKRSFRPARWRYRDTHAALEAAGRLVDTELAERRNLILINPHEGNGYATAATLVSAYQMILPGERARSHRHTPNALRLVLDAAPGAYTIVDGVRFDMAPNDVVLTPNWCWHGHGNDGDAAAYWIDYLDVPLVHALEPMFYEGYPGDFEPATSVAQQSSYLYRWSETKARLAAAEPERSGCFGRQIALDAFHFKTIGLFMLALDSGRPTAELRTTANNIYSVVSGRGRTTIDSETFAWERGDVLVAPAWRPHHHESDGDAVLFRVTDAPLLAALDWLRS
jgi:gentisate 1,2-dioxygenase